MAMKANISATVLLLSLAACASNAPVSLSTSAAQNMLAQPLPEYAAKLRIARQISASCERYEFNDQMQVALSAARPDTAGGRLQAIRQGPGIALATDVELRSFQAKHGVDISSANLCAAGDREVAEQTGISALLVAS